MRETLSGDLVVDCLGRSGRSSAWLEDAPNQQWKFVATTAGYYTLRAVNSEKCLAVSSAQRRSGYSHRRPKRTSGCCGPRAPQ
ncbi:RICIN domain-containing protein [Streptomyces sp. NPDC048473]|uniref:RICIN domain-containing protein n=1 Tax=unclassified Streptomyces TaxID=2593676 RepID=UPI003720ADBD